MKCPHCGKSIDLIDQLTELSNKMSQGPQPNLIVKQGECPPEQIGTCEGCSDKECLNDLVSKNICLVHGTKGCDCTLERDQYGHFTTKVIPRKKEK